MIDRRAFLSLVGAVSTACGAPAVIAPPSLAPPRTPPPKTIVPHEIDVVDWAFPSELGGEKRCVVMVPRPLPREAKLPVLIALHGLGETSDPRVGANAWLKAYELDRAYLRMYEPPLDPATFFGFVTSERLTEINEDLAAKPFGGLIVACPYMPKEIGGPVPIETYARWLGERLLPKIRRELPADPSVRATGIDGVSLGGWAALRIAMARPDLFGVVGALQPALMDVGMVEWAHALIRDKLGKRPLRLVTSTEDLYRYTIAELDKRLTAAKIAHGYCMTQGPHDYPWNKGPGGIEMLLFHDRALRT